MWKLIYEPTAKFCTDVDGVDSVFISEEEALKSIADMPAQHRCNYRGFAVGYFTNQS